MGSYPEALAEIEAQLSELPHLAEALAASAVYFLMSGQEIVYVGQTTNLYARIGSHRDDKIWDRILFLIVPREELDATDRRWIAALQPKYNTSPGQRVNPHRVQAARLIRTGRTSGSDRQFCEVEDCWNFLSPRVRGAIVATAQHFASKKNGKEASRG
jgi:hypothetical protein